MRLHSPSPLPQIITLLLLTGTSVLAHTETDVFSCLHLKALCKQIPECRFHLRHLEAKCGISTTNCLTNSVSDCVHCLRSIRGILGVHNPTCWCYESISAIRECKHFKHKIWHHPCEQHISDLDVDDSKLFSVPVAPDPLLLTEESKEDIDVFNKVAKRTTRSPMAQEIEQWKRQLNGALPTVLAKSASHLTCHAALYDVCLRHIACRELWKIFRESCIVDAQNQCRMTNRDNCWQSFEGLSWTGLGTCTCVDSNSDCHWIRLQTNYNKCIYELSLSGYSLRNGNTDYIHHYREHQAQPAHLSGHVAWQSPTNLPEPSTITMAVTTTTSSTRAPAPSKPPLAILSSHQRERERPSQLAREREQEERRRAEHLRNERQRQYEERRRAYEEQLRRLAQSKQNTNRNHLDNRTHVPQNRTAAASVRGTGNGSAERVSLPVVRAELKNGHRTSSTPETVVTSLPPPPINNRLPMRNSERVRDSTRPPTSPPQATTSTTTTSSTTPATTTTTTTTTATTTTTTTTTTKPLLSSTTPLAALAESTESLGPLMTLVPSMETSKEDREPTPPDSVEVKTATDARQNKGTSAGAPVLSHKQLNIRNKSEKRGSTCQAAHKRCDANETCKWHLSEVQMRCDSEDSCYRDQCAAALRRFSRYVTKSLAESMTFCQCAPADSDCKQYQHLIYPMCMYSHSIVPANMTCSEAVQKCQRESYCNRRLKTFNRTCSVSVGGGCSSKDLAGCREGLLAIRGTFLEMPCYCDKEDRACLQEQSLMLPSNPCVESAMDDFAKTNTLEYTAVTVVDENDISVQSMEKTHTFAPSKESTSEQNVQVEQKAPSSSSAEVKSHSALEKLATKHSKEKQKEMAHLKVASADEKPKTIVASEESEANITNASTKPYRQRLLHTYPTDAYVTHMPPPEGGCVARNIDGTWITHYKNSVVRQYNDWSGQCSSWCHCSEDEKLTCHELPCLPKGTCKSTQTESSFGEKLYIDKRGACLCQSGKFICDTSADMPEELEPGLYITFGFSTTEIKIFKDKVPKRFREKSGLVSPESSIVKDIVSRLQFALERVMPKGTLCRIIILDELTHGSNAVLQLQWYGVNPYANETESRWHIGKMEKNCAPYVQQLQYAFLLEKADRYQLVLSAVKQIRVIDLLNGLPEFSASTRWTNHFFFLLISWLLSLTLLLR